MTDQDLIGEKVVSPIYGIGQVTGFNETTQKLSIEFAKYGKKYFGFEQFSEKTTNKPSHFENLTAQEYILRRLSEKKPTELPSFRKTFFVFQGITFEDEFYKECLCAPLSNLSSRWEMMRNVRYGDIIFHSNKGNICGISQALSSAEVVPTPKWISKHFQWASYREARMVPLESCLIKIPLKAEAIGDIIGYCCAKTEVEDTPFDSQGEAKNGYLFRNPKLLSLIFLDYILNDNPNLRDVKFIKAIWTQLNSSTELVEKKQNVLQKLRGRSKIYNGM